MVHNDNKILSISTAMLFSLNDSKMEHQRLLDKHQLDLIIDNAIGRNIFWDSGVPKGSGEFLVYGSAYSTQAVRGLGVSVTVGNEFKILMVFGDRVWTQRGISEATPFKVIPINYNYAFGGQNYELNPIGKGYSNKEGTNLLPNIESPNQLIVKQSDTTEPASFEPYPPEWPQRSKYFTNCADIDLTNDVIKLPNTIVPKHFNTAPVDQRLSGFFIGDEKIEIQNMHPLLPTIKSSLPAIRLRQFVIQKDSQGIEEFHEIGVRIDTLSLLPNLEYGILTYRSTCNVANIEADDISYIYSALEALSEDPKPIEYYFQSLVADGTIHVETIESNVANSDNKDLPGSDDIGEEIISQIPQNEGQQAEPSQLNNNTKIDEPKEVDLTDLSQQLNHINNDAMGLGALGKHMISEVQKIMSGFSLTEQDVNKYAKQRQESGLDIIPSENELIAQMQKLGINNPELEKTLRDNMKSINEAMQKLKQLDKESQE